MFYIDQANIFGCLMSMNMKATDPILILFFTKLVKMAQGLYNSYWQFLNPKNYFMSQVIFKRRQQS